MHLRRSRPVAGGITVRTHTLVATLALLVATVIGPVGLGVAGATESADPEPAGEETAQGARPTGPPIVEPIEAGTAQPNAIDPDVDGPTTVPVPPEDLARKIADEVAATVAAELAAAGLAAGEPTAAGTTTPPTSAPTTAATPTDRSHSTDPVANPDPTAAAAGDPSINVNVSVASDGTAPFVDWLPTDTFSPNGNRNCPSLATVPSGSRTPGDDCHPNTLIVRTLDITQFTVDYQLLPSPVTLGQVVLTITVSAGARIPDGWAGPLCGNGAVGGFTPPSTVTCTFAPGITNATTGAVDVAVVVPPSTPDGSTFSASASIVEADHGLSASDQSDQVTVSAAPRFELVKEATNRRTAAGPPGSTGQGELQEWTIGIRSAAVDQFGNPDIRGLQALDGPVVLDDLAFTTPSTVPEWFHDCPPGSAPGWPALVGSAPISSPGSQLRTASVSCSPGTSPSSSLAVTVTLSGIDWNRATAIQSPPNSGTYVPAPAPDNGQPAGRRGLVAYFRLFTWTSHADLTASVGPPGGSAVVCNTVETSGPGRPAAGTFAPTTVRRPWDPNGATSTWAPVDINDRPNLNGMDEPVANNGACFYKDVPVVVPPDPFVNAGIFKQPWSPNINGAGVYQSTVTQSRLGLFTQGNMAQPAGATVCDKWDTSHFDLLALNLQPLPTGVTVTIEYGEGPWGASASAGGLTTEQKWFNQATMTCADATSVVPWGPRGPGSNAVRIVLDQPLPLNGIVDARPTWQMNSSPLFPPGEEFRNYAAFFMHQGTPPTTGSWHVSTCTRATANSCPKGLSRGESAGSFSHWWTILAGSVEVAKSVVGDVNVEAGATFSWRVRARGVPGAGGAPPTGTTHAVVLREELPPGMTYVGPTISTVGNIGEPSCVSTTPPPIAFPAQQVCTWGSVDMPWLNDPSQFNVDFTFAESTDPFTPPNLYTNWVEGRTPDDPTELAHRNLGTSVDPRRASAQVRIGAARRAHIDKSVSPSSPQPGDTLTFTLRYGNPAGTPVASMDAIDILPFDGDPRGSSFTPSSFVLTGITPSPAGGEVIWVSSVAPATLDLLGDNVADGYLDPQSSPLTGPTWCLLSAVGTASCPPSLAAVTAVRFVGSPTPAGGPFLPPGSPFHAITISYAVGPCTLGDSIANSWLARFEGLFFPVLFPADAAGVSGCAGGLTVAKEVRDAEGAWVESVTVPAGSDVTWRITVTNSGGTPLTNLTVTDPAFTGCETAGVAAAPAILEPGASFSFVCTNSAVPAGYVNTVTVGGTDPDGGLVQDEDDAAVIVTRTGTPKGPPPTPTPGPVAFTGSDLDDLVLQALACLLSGVAAVTGTSPRRRARFRRSLAGRRR